MQFNKTIQERRLFARTLCVDAKQPKRLIDMEIKISPETLLNFKDLCKAVLKKDLFAAYSILEQRSHILFSEDDCPDFAMRLFLSSMNSSIYNYINFALDLSLTQGYLINLPLTHNCHNQAEFYQIAHKIIQNYLQLFESPGESNCHVRQALKYMDEHLDEQLKLNDIAKSIHVSAGYLSKCFTTCTGKSFSEQLKERRLTRACTLLLSTNMTILDIAQTCGFCSPAHFSSSFKKWTGMSPREYRNCGNLTPEGSNAMDSSHSGL